MPKARVVFAELARLLGEQAYFTGEAISLADLMVAPRGRLLHRDAGMGGTRRAATHNLVAWLARMEARPSMKATTWERVNEMAKAA